MLPKEAVARVNCIKTVVALANAAPVVTTETPMRMPRPILRLKVVLSLSNYHDRENDEGQIGYGTP